MREKGLGSKVLGWFVVPDVADGDAEKKPADDASAEELIAKYSAAPPPPPAPPEVKLTGALPEVGKDGSIDLPAVYRAAGITDDEQSRIDKARTLLGTLPKETPHEVKKQIVEASLKAFNVPIDKIIETGAQEIQALEVYIRAGQTDTQNLLQQSQKRLAELNDEIARVNQVMAQQVSAQQALTEGANRSKLLVQEVLEFFGQDAVARVVKESPKLHEPGSAQ